MYGLIHTQIYIVSTSWNIQEAITTYMDSTILNPLQLPLRIWEVIFVKLIIAPLEPRHPETVEMEHADRNIALCHSIQKRCDCAFVILGCKASAKPEPEGPRRRECRFARDCCIALYN